jgi:hypothetical protein
VTLPPIGQKLPLERGVGSAIAKRRVCLGWCVLKQLLEIEGQGGQQHHFMGATATPRIHAPQPVVLEQAAKHRFNGALPQSPHVAAGPALLPGERAAVMGIVSRANELSLLDIGRTGGLAWAQAAVPTGGAVYFR